MTMKLEQLGSILMGAVLASLMPTGRIDSAAADPAERVEGNAVAQHKSVTFDQKTPNVDLVASGVFTLGLPYVTSIVVAAESEREGDQFLYSPVAGPWLDLARRGGCASGSCEGETAYKGLLVADGVLQSAGALEIAMGFLFPLPHSVYTGSLPRFHIAPNLARTSAGLTAAGVF